MITTPSPTSARLVEISDFGLSCSDVISIIGIIITTVLAVWSIIQNHRYKVQTDRFVDLQYMPEMFLRSQTVTPEFPRLNHQLSAQPDGTNTSAIVGVFIVDKAPVYSLQIEKIIVDGTKYINKSEKNSIDVYPHEPFFYLEPFFPKVIENEGTHSAQVILTYSNMYDTKYKKQIDINFSQKKIRKIKCNKAERYK